jgi:hypothetical protein
MVETDKIRGNKKSSSKIRSVKKNEGLDVLHNRN